MPSQIKLYALSTCPACRKTKALLDANDIAYECKHIDLLEGLEQMGATNEVKKYNPELTFPTLVVGDTIVVGYNEERIKKAVGIK